MIRTFRMCIVLALAAGIANADAQSAATPSATTQQGVTPTLRFNGYSLLCDGDEECEMQERAYREHDFALKTHGLAPIPRVETPRVATIEER